MGKKYVIDESTLTDIADVIRDYGRPENAEKKYKPTDMRDGIVGVSDRAGTEGYDAGYIVGLDKGGEEGYKAGYTEGEVAGKQTAYDDFWDSMQNYGERSRYDCAFSYWGGENFRPKYKVVPTGVITATNGFYRFMNASDHIRILEKEYIDLSHLGLATGSAQAGWRQTFQTCTKLEIVEDIGMQPAAYYFTFTDSYKLHTIEVLRFAEDTQENSGFKGCSSLRNITIEGTIGRKLNFGSCPLSVKSLKSVIEHLKDYTGGSEYTYTITFKTSAFEALEAEGTTAEYNGTPCTWAELIDNKKWNLTLA